MISVAPEAVAEFALVLERLRGLELTVLNGRPEPEILRLDPAAMDCWIRFYDEHNQELITLSGDLAAAWAKLEGYAARLALVIHLTRWAEGDSALVSAEALDETSMAAGIQLARWFGQEARQVYAMIDETSGDAPEAELLAWIKNRGGVVGVRDLTHHLRRFRGRPALAHATLNELVSDGRGEWDYPPPGVQGGRPREMFHLFVE